MKHDLCRKAVKELVIDFQTIDSSLSLVKFVEHALPSLVWSPRSTAVDYETMTGARVSKLLKLIEKEELQQSDIKTSKAAVAYGRLIKRFKGEKIGFEALVEAYQAYKRLEDQQKEIESSGEYERLLTLGLSQLDDSINVTATRSYFVVTDWWLGPRKEDGMRVCPNGPPFLRSWPFNLASLVEKWTEHYIFGRFINEYHENDQHIYPLITRACSLSGRKPRRLMVDKGPIPFQFFDMSSVLARSKSMAQSMFDIYSSLEVFRLEINVDESYHENSDDELQNALRRAETGLNTCLAKMQNLVELELRFRVMYCKDSTPPLVSFDNLFRDLRYKLPRLYSFEITGMKATAKGLIGFLAAFPLGHIDLGDIDLIGGSRWISTFEAMRADFKPPPIKAYYICRDLWEEGSDSAWEVLRGKWLYQRFEEFIRDGRRNPMGS